MMIPFLHEKQIPYTIRRSKRTKRQKLVISSSKLEIVIPHRFKEKLITPFVENHQEWIINNWQKHNTNIKNYSMPGEFSNQSKLPYRGRLFQLCINIENIIIPRISFTDNFNISFPDYLKTGKHPLEIRKLYKEYLMQQLNEDIKNYLHSLSIITNISAKSYKIKKQQTRWGSCSSTGNININFNLIFAPKEVLEYVVIHEFCHLKHPNHSATFWKMVNSLCPNYKTHKNWLNTNQHIINFSDDL